MKVSIVFSPFPLESYPFKRLDGCHLILHFLLSHHARKINPGKTARKEYVLESDEEDLRYMVVILLKARGRIEVCVPWTERTDLCHCTAVYHCYPRKHYSMVTVNVRASTNPHNLRGTCWQLKLLC